MAACIINRRESFIPRPEFITEIDNVFHVIKEEEVIIEPEEIQFLNSDKEEDNNEHI